MADSPIDFAGLETQSTATADTTVETPVVDTDTTETVETPTTETTTETTETTEGKEETQKYNSDGSPIEKAVAKAEDDGKEFGENTPQDVRKALAAFKKTSPEAAAMAKMLHGSYERHQAYSKVFPKVADAQQAKEFIDLIGGNEGYEKIQGTVQAAEASDALLYEGNPELIQNIVEDLKAQGKLDALGKLAPSFLDSLKSNDEKGYYSAFAPHFLDGLKTVNMPGAINGLLKSLSDPDPAKAVAAAKGVADQLKEWYDGLESENKKTKENVVSPERQQLDKERAAFKQQQEEFKTNQTKEFQDNVAKVCEKSNNQLLGAQLKDFLRMPFFKGFGRENLMPLGNTIKSNLYATLKADNAYQAQMKAMWGAKTPDRAKIEEYHKARVESIAKDIVRDTVQRMYPGYAKGGAAAGRVAAATEKKAAVAKVENKAIASGKPIYVAQKPSRESIDMDHLDKHGKNDAVMEMIAGRAYLKGSGKWVTWRK